MKTITKAKKQDVEMEQGTNYYDLKYLDVSAVKLFAQNPARALDSWNGVKPWFDDNKALAVGQYVHAGLEEFLTGRKEIITDVLKQYKDELLTIKGLENANTKMAKNVLSVLESNEAVRAIRDGSQQGLARVEESLFGTIDGVEVKGKVDAMIIYKPTKTVYMYDFKTSQTYPADGFEWIDTIEGKRRYDSVIWDRTKLFPWQASLYKELLLQQEEFAGWNVEYQYIVGTKEKTPRVDIFQMTDEVLNEGLKQFKEALATTDKILKGELEADTIADGSQWYNATTQKNGNLITATLPQK